MSLAELLPAVSALSQEERKSLLNYLVERVREEDVLDDGIPAELLWMIPPPGTIIEMPSRPMIDAAGMEVLIQAMEEMKVRK